MASMNKGYRWSTGIADITGDPKSTAFGAFCPCLVFGRNVHSITDGDVSFFRACLTHALLGGCWGAPASLLCGPLGYWFTCVPCYSYRFRGQLRQKNGLPEMPYSDFATHYFCHPFAVCQEFREIKSMQRSTLEGPQHSTIDRGTDETIDHVNKAIQQMER